MKQLRKYQTDAIDAISAKYAAGMQSIVFQLATGGGKTITAAALINRFRSAIPRKVVFVVHRTELLNQFRKTLYQQHGLIAEPIVAGVKYCNPAADVYVTMVETANNRLKKNPSFFGDVGLVIIDEAHIGSFKKLYKCFPTALRIGLSATPVHASKRHPMNLDYSSIVCGIDIPDLVRQGSLVPNKTYHIKNSVDRKSIGLKNGEFDNTAMGKAFSSNKHVHNCVEAYRAHAEGSKAIVFNCNVAHSLLVNDAFIEAGYPARHLDGTMPDEQRSEILHWFANTPGAVLNNIGILTAGFDEPTIETVIMNRMTTSLPLWLQCTGRGSRPCPEIGKSHFTIIDLGGNAVTHGDWCSNRDWEYIFNNPAKFREGGGAAPIKICVNEKCEAIISAMARTCEFCGEAQPFAEASYDGKNIELELLASNIVVEDVTAFKPAGYKPQYTLHQIKGMIVSDFRKQSETITSDVAYKLLDIYQEKVREWCQINNNKYTQWYKETTAQWFFAELKRVFGWEPQELTLTL